MSTNRQRQTLAHEVREAIVTLQSKLYANEDGQAFSAKHLLHLVVEAEKKLNRLKRMIRNDAFREKQASCKRTGIHADYMVGTGTYCRNCLKKMS